MQMLSFKRMILLCITLLFVLWVSFPLFVMLKISVSSAGEVMRQQPSLGIEDVTMRHWQGVLKGRALRQPLQKSLAVACLATLITLLIGVPGAYGISRLPREWGNASMLMLFVTRLFPEVCLALPISVVFLQWNLLDTSIGLASAHVIRVLPIACWLLVGTFRTIPRELEEQAEVDGGGKGMILWKVVLPLSIGGISVAAIFAWLFSWDEFTYALYLCLAEPTLPLKVYYYITRGNWFLTATYATMITIPVVLVTYVLQRFLKAGYTAGAIKG